MRRKSTFFGLFLLLLSVILSFVLNFPTSHEEVIRFPSVYKDRNVTLEASYYEEHESEYAVLICPGYSCDRQKWRPMADLFKANGYTVMTFDYAGQGASSDTIGFDNAKTDAIPREIDDAIEVLHQKSGIAYDHIILAGHSMGGRALLRLMYDYHNPKAVTDTVSKPVKALLLFSPEVNYEFSAQASLFAGTSDDTDPIWHEYSPSDIQETDVYLFGSTADDIVSDGDILAIYSHIGGEHVPVSGVYAAAQENSLGSHIEVGVVPGVLHSYQMYSPKFAGLVNHALETITGEKTSYSPSMFTLVYVIWFTGLAGVGFLLAGLNTETAVLQEEVPVLQDAKAYLIRKALLWIPGLIAAFLICCICVIMPFGSPVMNTPYLCGIAGYGLITAFAYRKGTFRGTSGKLPKLQWKIRMDKETGKALLVSLGVCFALWYILRTTMYRLVPFNARLFWCFFAGVLMSVGYYTSGCEQEMLKKAEASKTTVIIYNLIQYVALFLLVIFYLVLKSYSGMIGQIQNMILMYVFCIPLGTYLQNRTGNRLFGSLVSAFLFQALMITSAALIAIL